VRPRGRRASAPPALPGPPPPAFVPASGGLRPSAGCRLRRASAAGPPPLVNFAARRGLRPGRACPRGARTSRRLIGGRGLRSLRLAFARCTWQLSRMLLLFGAFGDYALTGWSVRPPPGFSSIGLGFPGRLCARHPGRASGGHRFGIGNVRLCSPPDGRGPVGRSARLRGRPRYLASPASGRAAVAFAS